MGHVTVRNFNQSAPSLAEKFVCLRNSSVCAMVTPEQVPGIPVCCAQVVLFVVRPVPYLSPLSSQSGGARLSRVEPEVKAVS